MAYYMTNGEFQAHMKDYYQRTGNRLQFPEMTEYLYNKGFLYDSIPAPDLTNTLSPFLYAILMAIHVSRFPVKSMYPMAPPYIPLLLSSSSLMI